MSRITSPSQVDIDGNTTSFFQLVMFLREMGYKVVVRKPTRTTSYHSAWVSRKNIHAAFCEPNKESYRQINGHFAADNNKCFNKWSQCPLVVKIPETDAKRQELLKHLVWLSTDEGQEWSSTFGYIDYPILPMVV